MIMPIVIEKYENAKLVSVEPLSDVANEDWGWRRIYIGSSGVLKLCESRKKNPGGRFAVISDGWYKLRTGYGTAQRIDGLMVFTTSRSRYVFALDESGAVIKGGEGQA